MSGTQYSLLAPSLNAIPAVKETMCVAAHRSRLSREQIADEMNRLAEANGIRLGGNGGIKKDTLEKWMIPTEREHSPSLLGLLIFCHVLGVMAPLEALVAPLGITLVDAEGANILRVARLEREIERLQQERRRLRAVQS